MSRKIDIELTSRRDDGSWTWRAPGAKQPRGTVDGALLPSGAAVGDVLKADADFELDGIFVISVQAPKETRPDTEDTARIEVIGSGRNAGVGVSVSMAPGSRRRRDEEQRGRFEGRTRPETPRRGAPRPRAEAEGGESRPERLRQRPDRERPRRQREAAPRSENGLPGAAPRGAGDKSDRERARLARAPRSREETPTERRDRRKLQVVSTHRNAALAGLRPEQLPVAEQLLRGGIPAVRRAIEEQNARARAEDRAEISPEPLLAMAEELLPSMTLAAWKDRAVTVRTAGREAPLREVRSVVAGASAVTLDDEARALLSALRESLDERVTALREAWISRITSALDEERVAEALRVSSRPPEPSARVPGALAMRLSSAAGAAMSPELAEEHWSDLLAAVVNSPVRRTVKPAGLPAEASEDLLLAARRAAGSVPELAKLLGLPIPPPPGPRRPAAAGAARRG